MPVSLLRIWRDRRGNVAIIFALAAMPMMLAVAIGLDYVSTARRWTKLNAIADAAALSAVTPYMMGQPWSVAKLAATNMFLAQAALTPGLNITASNVTITGGDLPSATGVSRTIQISYSAARSTTFPGLLGRQSLNYSHSSASKAVTTPNVDFYLLLDTSPSMAIAATQTGISQMVALTPSQGGCAFACHEQNPAADGLGNPGGEDNYALARNNNITLRIDLVAQATQNLITTAQSTEGITHAQYRMAIDTFDASVKYLAALSSNLPLVALESSNIQVLETYKNGWLTALNNDNDTDTNFGAAMTSVNATIASPGGGSNNIGDSPQKFLFIVTDGVVDDVNNGNREMIPMGGTACTAIKNRGINIAVLYTTYNPLPTNSFYNTYIAPFQSTISSSLQSCATPGYFYEVDTGGDISAALNSLFQKAVGTAHLTQ